MKDPKRTIRFFDLKKADLNKRISEDFLDGDLAVIACKVTDYSDVINRYSVEGYESPNPELLSYIEDCAKYIPMEYPLVLDITGCSFSDKQQETIKTAFRDYYTYDLCDAMATRKKGIIGFIVMFVLMLASAYVFNSISAQTLILADLIYIGFWVCADTVFSFLFGGGSENRRKKILAARIQSMQIKFEKKYDDLPYTESEAEEIVSEMMSEKDS